MKKNLLTLLLLAATTMLSAQTTTNYWIVFKDKNNSPFSVKTPGAYLSERSIARRERQHIEITAKDLPVNPSYINSLKTQGAVIKNRSKWYNAVTVSLPDETKLNAIKALPFVKSVMKITITPSATSASKFDMETTSVPVEEKQLPPTKRMASPYSYGPSYNQAHMLGVDCMHGWGYTGQGMVIAQLDAGFYNVNILPAFDSLRINDQILGCRDFVSGIPGDTMVFEDYPHGMNVLSCMGGNLPGSIVGTAPKASYWLLRTEDAGSESVQEEINWMVAAEFADSVGADIINSSLGYSVFDDMSTSHTFADLDGNTTIVTKAADWAASVGIFVVSSAGNSGGPPWYKITAPADGDSVLTIGAVDSSEVIRTFSSRGPTADGRIKPSTVAKGGGACIAANEGGITFANGTSFSSPITAGAVACLWQANPTKTNMELYQAILQSSDQYAFPDTIKGYGVPDFCAANQILAGISENHQPEETISVYPNPFNSNFEISFYSQTKQSVQVDLFDISGRSISSVTKEVNQNILNKFSMNASNNLPAGIYIVQVRTKDQVFVRKMVKE